MARNAPVSILIPAFNAEPWIAASIRSALAQCWPNKEVIVVDDGSTDGTLAVARTFASRQVAVHTQENRGASAARNRALSAAQGDYIQWLDADNLLAPGKISAHMNRAEALGNSRILLSSAWGRFFYRPWKTRFTPTPLWTDLSPAEWMYRKLDGNLYMIPESWLVSRELTDAAGGWDERLSLDDDGEYFTRIIAGAEAVHFVPGARSYYRTGNPGSLSSVTRRPDAKLASQFLSIRLHIEALRSLEDTPRTRAACLKFLQRWFIYFYPEKTELVEQARSLARELGGSLVEPDLNGKYAAIRLLFGWSAAKNASFVLPSLKLRTRRSVDRLLYLCRTRVRENADAAIDRS